MKRILPLLLLLFVLILPGCGDDPPSYNCSISGLANNTTYKVRVDYGSGNIREFERYSGTSGTITIEITVPCTHIMSVIPVTYSNLSLSASPSSVYLLSPPSTVTVTGDLFDQTYGMPRVDYFDGNGYLVGSVYATSVWGSTSLTANVPDLS